MVPQHVFEKSDQIYNLIAEIYDTLGNKEPSKNILNLDLRQSTISSLKNELSGIYKKNNF